MGSSPWSRHLAAKRIRFKGVLKPQLVSDRLGLQVDRQLVAGVGLGPLEELPHLFLG